MTKAFECLENPVSSVEMFCVEQTVDDRNILFLLIKILLSL